ncbi:MAG: hydantoinase/oxoprolinase family protein [Planctomycetota bacterium]
MASSFQTTVIGLDIGGANLKYADSQGRTHCTEFPLWQRPEELRRQLLADLKKLVNGEIIGVAAAMTGELADCFLDRRRGVAHIVERLDAAVATLNLPPPVYYGADGCFRDSPSAIAETDLTAAANWHALGTFVAREYASDGWLIDIGSTTTDIIPLRNGQVATKSQTDFDRLAAQELVYLGGARTPVCSIIDSLQVESRPVPVMREVFATMDDVRILLGFTDEAPNDHQSADGTPRDRSHAANRVARMVGLDHRRVDIDQATDLAKQIHAAARSIVKDATAKIPRGASVVVSGHARDLLENLGAAERMIDLTQRLGAEVSRVAPAFAVAKLLSSVLPNACDAP